MLLLPFLQQPTTHQLHHQLQPSTIITTPLPPRRAPPAQGVGLTTWRSLSPFNPLCPSPIHRCRRFRDNFQVSMPFSFLVFLVCRFFFFYFFFSTIISIFFYLTCIWKSSTLFWKFGFFSFTLLIFFLNFILSFFFLFYLINKLKDFFT